MHEALILNLLVHEALILKLLVHEALILKLLVHEALRTEIKHVTAITLTKAVPGWQKTL